MTDSLSPVERAIAEDESKELARIAEQLRDDMRQAEELCRRLDAESEARARDAVRRSNRETPGSMARFAFGVALAAAAFVVTMHTLLKACAP